MTLATLALNSAPKEPVQISSEARKRAYFNHFALRGGGGSEADASYHFQSPDVRACWSFPDGSRVVSDWAGWKPRPGA
jgi:hypothetical protein